MCRIATKAKQAATGTVLTVASRARWAVVGWSARRLGIDLMTGVKLRQMPNLERLGSDAGGWVVPTHLLGSSSVCYCAGVGEDITFDLELVRRFGCQVYAFDPTPRAEQHVLEHAAGLQEYHFAAVGLWDEQDVLRFYAPANPEHVSHSVLNLQRTTDYFEAPCKRLSTIMRENGHGHLDLLKLDIEGAEYRVIDSIVEDQLRIGIICVEYDEASKRLDNRYRRRIQASVSQLLGHDYALVAAEAWCNYTFVRQDLLV